MQLPSKELLSLIFNKKVTWLMDIKEDVDTHNTSKIVFQFDNIYYGGISGIEDEQINVYELAHKCKEWAHNSGYIIITYPIGHGEWDTFVVLNGGSNIHKEPLWNSYHEESEPEAIFKACQYILDNKKD